MKLFALILAAIAALSAMANDTIQLAERLDPNLQTDSTRAASDYSQFTFLHPEYNVVNLNGDNWDALRSKFQAAKSGEGEFTVVYLGDSHIQADFGGKILRQRLTADAGNAGRGLLIPFRAAGTNQPHDYSIAATGQYRSARLLKTPWNIDYMPYTGIGIQPENDSIRLDIHSETPFRSLEVVLGQGECQIGNVSAPGAETSVVGARTIVCDTLTADMAISLRVNPGTVIAGVVLDNGTPGVTVHSIGNNGAAFSSYNGLPRFGQEIATLGADLYIVALGTNEAFGAFRQDEVEENARILVQTLRQASPNAKIMLVAPPECMRRRNRRRRDSRLIVNQNVAKARQAVLNAARSEGIAVYDMYDLAGGRGAAVRMKAANVLGRDGVHFTADGYRLWGSLLSEAILEELKK